jgi:ABC-type multidrug transport system ATPase subunit
MEEADSVGDKIAIMALGRLRAIGSPMHLKQRFGMGYSVQIVTTEERVSRITYLLIPVETSSKRENIRNIQCDKRCKSNVGCGITFVV